MRLFSVITPWKSGTSTSAKIIADFLQQPAHNWILSDRALRNSMVEFLGALPKAHLNEILVKRRLLLLYCNQKMSCTFYQYTGREIVLVFPDLRKRLASAAPQEAHAVLAHELGHIICGHAQKKISMITAQLEADRYAWERGFGAELFAVLSQERASEDLITRLQALKALIQKLPNF